MKVVKCFLSLYHYQYLGKGDLGMVHFLSLDWQIVLRWSDYTNSSLCPAPLCTPHPGFIAVHPVCSTSTKLSTKSFLRSSRVRPDQSQFISYKTGCWREVGRVSPFSSSREERCLCSWCFYRPASRVNRHNVRRETGVETWCRKKIIFSGLIMT